MVGPLSFGPEWYVRDARGEVLDLSRSSATIETIILLTSWVVMRIWYFKKITPLQLILVFILNTGLINISFKLWGECTYWSLQVVERSKNDDCLGNKNATLNYMWAWPFSTVVKQHFFLWKKERKKNWTDFSNPLDIWFNAMLNAGVLGNSKVKVCGATNEKSF